MAQSTCSVAGCLYRTHARGWCQTHYGRMWKYGSLDSPTPSLEERFWSKVNKTATCWLWTSMVDRGGYGRFAADRAPQLAHRVAYELVHGFIPTGLTLDHLCGVHACVNPTHLEPVTLVENLRRRFASHTHCKRGHEWTPENTYVETNGRNRQCRACARWRKQQRAA